jgi:hypothetical protein
MSEFGNRGPDKIPYIKGNRPVVEIEVEVMFDPLFGDVPVDAGHTENMIFAAPVELGNFINSLLIGFTVFPFVDKVCKHEQSGKEQHGSYGKNKVQDGGYELMKHGTTYYHKKRGFSV